MLRFIFLSFLLCCPAAGQTIGELVRQLGGEDSRARNEARDELLRRGEQALPEIRKALGGEMDPIAKSLLTDIAEKIERTAGDGRLIASLSEAIRGAAPDMVEKLKDPTAKNVEAALLWMRGNAGKLSQYTQADLVAVARLTLRALDRNRDEDGWETVLAEVCRGFHADPDRLYAELRPLVDHPDKQLRRWVLSQIRDLRRAEHADDMLALLDGDAEVVAAASRALGNMPSGKHSGAVAEALERVGPKGEEGLLRAIRRTGDARYSSLALDRVVGGFPQTRMEALVTLLRLDPKKGIEKLGEALRVPDEEDRNQGKLTLVVMAAAETDDPGIQEQVEVLFHSAKSAGLRHSALYYLVGRRGERGARIVVEALTSEDENLRIGAAAAARMCVNADKVKEALVIALDDPSERVRANAARSLAAQVPENCREKVRAMLDSKDSHVRAMAVGALAWSPDSKAHDRLVGLVSDKDWLVSMSAMETAGAAQLSAAKAALLTRMEDPEPTVRVTAARALSRLGEKRAIPVLADFLDSDLRAQTLEGWTEMAAPALFKTLAEVTVRTNPASPGRVRDLVSALTAAYKVRGIAVLNGLPEALLSQPIEWHGSGLPPADVNAAYVLWTLHDSCCEDFVWFAADKELHLLNEEDGCRRWREWAKAR